MAYSTLITASELAKNLSNPNWVIVDCRFSLDDTARGRRGYLQSHIPGAVYAHLNEDLSGQVIAGKTGRHPLPRQEKFVQTLSNWGIDSKIQVVTYDDKGGAMAAARLWWMLRMGWSRCCCSLERRLATMAKEWLPSIKWRRDQDATCFYSPNSRRFVI